MAPNDNDDVDRNREADVFLRGALRWLDYGSSGRWPAEDARDQAAHLARRALAFLARDGSAGRLLRLVRRGDP